MLGQLSIAALHTKQLAVDLPIADQSRSARCADI
jgi:hypothetical protein